MVKNVKNKDKIKIRNIFVLLCDRTFNLLSYLGSCLIKICSLFFSPKYFNALNLSRA